MSASRSTRPFGMAAMVGLCAVACGQSAPPVMRPDAGGSDACLTRYAVARRRPEISIVLDRSCAMQARFDGSMASGPDDTEGRWGAVRAAIGSLGTSTRLAEAGLAGVGLVLFPGEGELCGVDGVRVDPFAGGVDAVVAALDESGIDPFAACAAGPRDVPLTAGLAAIAESEGIGLTGEPLTLVVIAGAPTCGATSETLAAAIDSLGTDVALLTLGVDATTAALFDAIENRRDATDAAGVRAALEDIVAERASCVLDLEGPPSPDPERLRVWIDGAPLASDPDEGWTLSAGDDAIALNGAACAALLGGELTRVDVAVDCETPGCVARPEACDGLDDDCDDQVDEDCT